MPQSGSKCINILEYTKSGLSSSYESDSSVEPDARNKAVKIVYTVNSSVHLSRAGTRSIGGFTKLTDRKSIFQSGISCSHKYDQDGRQLTFKEKKRSKRLKKSATGATTKEDRTSMRKTTHTTGKR